MKNIVYIFILLLASCNPAIAQYNRATMQSNINSNVYPNGRNAITGQVMNGVLTNQNNSYVNLLSDTNLLDVRQFSPYATYTPGMGAFHGDTLYMNISAAHGSWSRSNWMFIAGGGCACYTFVQWSDTGSGQAIATNHTVAVATDPLIPWDDTLTKIATNHSVLQTIASYPFLSWPDTSLALTTKNQVAVALASYIPFSDTNTKVATYKYVAAFTASTDWLTLGNQGLSYLNYIGPTDTGVMQFRQNGVQAGFIDGIKYHNTFLGVLTPRAYGQHNTGFGTAVLTNLTSGKQNTGIGSSALTNVITGINNTAIGYNAGELSQGSSNTNVGAYAGILDNYSHNIWIGDSANPKSAFTTSGYDLVAGYHAISTAPNQTVYGNPHFDTIFHFCYALSPDTIDGSGNIQYNYGTIGQVYTSQGKGHPNKWTTPSGGGGGVDTGLNKSALSVYQANKNFWSTTGNTGLSPATNFLGNTDSATLVFKVDGLQVGWIDDGSSNNGYSNTFFGYQGGVAITSGAADVGIGFQSLMANTSGNQNTSVGYTALTVNTTGSGNVGIGGTSLVENTTGSSNTALGNASIGLNVTGSGNTGVGYKSCLDVQGDSNTAIGDSSGYNITGNNNTAVGYASTVSNPTGHGQLVLGNSKTYQIQLNGAIMPFYSASYHAGTSGQVLTSQGANVAPQWTTVSGSLLGTTNTATPFLTTLGYNNGPSNTGQYNTSMGWTAMTANTSGIENVYIGAICGNADNASNNTFVGAFSNRYGVGGANSGLGYDALSNTSFSSNNCTSIGYVSGASITSGGNNTTIGSMSDVGTGSISNATAIGYSAIVSTSNTIMLGNTSVTDVETSGNLDIETVGSGLQIPTGTNATIGVATLVGGTVTVSTTAVTSTSIIFLTDATTGSLTNVGVLTVGTKTAGTSFVINSVNPLDTSNVNWIIINN